MALNTTRRGRSSHAIDPVGCEREHWSGRSSDIALFKPPCVDQAWQKAGTGPFCDIAVDKRPSAEVTPPDDNTMANGRQPRLRHHLAVVDVAPWASGRACVHRTCGLGLRAFIPMLLPPKLLAFVPVTVVF